MAKATWRGVTVSHDMVEPLEDLATTVPPKVTPIPGYGSYVDNDASGNTDNGGGHVDIYCGDAYGWNETLRKLFVANGRERGLMIFPRYKKWYSPVRKIWLTANWATHFHVIKKDTPDLSSGAKVQLSQWYDGSNGLAGFVWNGRVQFDPDEWDRTFLRQTWSQYLTLKEEEVDWNDVLTYTKGTSLHTQFPNGFTARGLLGYAALSMFKSEQHFKALTAQNAALTAAVKALANDESIDLAAIEAAAREGAKVDVELLAAALATQLDQVNEADIDAALRKVFADAGTRTA